MTEAEWLACQDPQAMLAVLGERASDRKLRLFAVACYRRIAPTYDDNPLKAGAVAMLERYAEGRADQADLSAAVDACSHRVTVRNVLGIFPGASALEMARGASFYAAGAAMSFPRVRRDDEAGISEGLGRMDRERAAHAELLRDLFGNPFRPLIFDPAWRTENAVAIARTIYEERAFERMPILGDALLDAGCDDEAILAHCRGDGPHVRGCWVLDLLLGLG